ncbi:Uncharacterised protein [Sphingobacterium thalpophilum]|uniref:Uncharacterized protein n=1 Tax=Sphingobacterium thalpophilum TaxID=259 RepID=A0A4U9UXI9_9SPHI|nr:Uncharacterised protein [Sphingobacterium thalpophilum]
MLSVVFLHVLSVRRFAPGTGYIFLKPQMYAVCLQMLEPWTIPKMQST